MWGAVRVLLSEPTEIPHTLVGPYFFSHVFLCSILSCAAPYQPRLLLLTQFPFKGLYRSYMMALLVLYIMILLWMGESRLNFLVILYCGPAMASCHVNSACPAREKLACLCIQGLTWRESGPLQLALHSCLNSWRDCCWLQVCAVSGPRVALLSGCCHVPRWITPSHGSVTVRKGYSPPFFPSSVLLDPVFVLCDGRP